MVLNVKLNFQNVNSSSNLLERGAAGNVRNCCSQLQVDHHNGEEGAWKEGQGYTGAHCQVAVLRTVSLHWKHIGVAKLGLQ